MMIIKKFKIIKKKIADGILNKTNIEELDNIINKWIQTKDILYINNEIKLVQENLIYITFFIRI